MIPYYIYYGPPACVDGMSALDALRRFCSDRGYDFVHLKSLFEGGKLDIMEAGA
ncbi:hypothetical protein HQ571_03995 [Candidatus Kuenenbacteria bacterium]|nr:hypothetical protein [Candidatus Kuenenbacteria bacterium]